MGLPTIKKSVSITDTHRTQAREMADTSHCDADMGRDESDHEVDAVIGVLGELLFQEMIDGTDDLSLEESDDSQYDYLLNGHKIEVKSRKTWNFSNPDLLVRKKFDLAARFYIQVDISTKNNTEPKSDLSNVTSATIVGYVTKDEVDQHGEQFSPPGKRDKNETVLIRRQRLHPLHELHARIC